jgi:signal recognition particle subunit SRP54
MKQFNDMRKMMRSMNKMAGTKGGMANIAKMMGRR